METYYVNLIDNLLDLLRLFPNDSPTLRNHNVLLAPERWLHAPIKKGGGKGLAIVVGR